MSWSNVIAAIRGEERPALAKASGDGYEISVPMTYGAVADVVEVGERISLVKPTGADLELVVAAANNPGDRGDQLDLVAVLPGAWPPKRPIGDDEPFADIRRVIRGLNAGDPSHFTADGKPDARHISETLGRRVSASERDEAWQYENGGGSHVGGQ